MAMALILVVSVLSSNLDLASAFLTSPIVYAAGRKPYGKMFCDMQVCLQKFKYSIECITIVELNENYPQLESQSLSSDSIAGYTAIPSITCRTLFD